MKNKIMDEPMVRKGIKERLVNRVMALVGLADAGIPLSV